LLCNMTVTLLWKCNELIVTQQELLRYYSNATTDLTCHNTIPEFASKDLGKSRKTSVGIADLRAESCPLSDGNKPL
jgi:hypothetical protein